MRDYLFARRWLASFGLLTLLIAPLHADEPGSSLLARSEGQIRQPLAFSLEQNEALGDVQYTSELIQTGSDCACDTCSDGGTDCSDCVACGCATCKKKKSKPNPSAKSHKGVFYANDFSYLNDPSYNGASLGDALKLNSVGRYGRMGTVDIGGQLRLRYHNEVGMGQNLVNPVGMRRFEDTQNDFLLTRLRLYTNWKVNDNIRFFAEGILADATDDNGKYAPRGIDRNYGDFLNLFVDVKLTDSTTVRVGRQELLYGVERTVSPLDWANTRRTFEGVKVMYNQGDWAIDGFYTNFVPPVASDFDEADYNRSFYGVYSTYKGWENASMDAYYLGYDNENAASAFPGSGDFSLHTLGVRLNGSIDSWLWEVEGGPQFGRQSGLGLDHRAFFATSGLGRQIADNSWKPTLWFYYDYASGDNMSGDFNGFNQLFPLAHKYLGFIDAIQRSNIESPNLLLTMKPTDKISLLCWYYHFMSNEATAVPAIGGQPTQNGSKDLGDELDLICKYTIGPRSDVLLGYSHFWRGNKLTGPQDADFVYLQWTTNF